MDLNEKQNKRIPVTILTGFLGAGKTTLLNRILKEKHGMRIAVIENEFGEVGIDNEFIVGANEKIFEMNNGCLCCSVRGDLLRTLKKLLKTKPKPEAILIETTGMADPGPIAQTFYRDKAIYDSYRVDAIVTMVDSCHIQQQMGREHEVERQIAFGDVVILNKTDLISAEALQALREWILNFNPTATLLNTRQADADLHQIIDIHAFDPEMAARVDPDFMNQEYPFEEALLLPASEVINVSCASAEHENFKLCVIPVPAWNDSEITTVTHRANILFCAKPQALDSGDEIPLNTLNLISVPEGHKSLYSIKPIFGKRHILFLEHEAKELSLHLSHYEKEIIPEWTKKFHRMHHHSSGITSVSMTSRDPLDLECFKDWMTQLLRAHGENIYRSKGILYFTEEKSRYVFQGVHTIFDCVEDRPWNQQIPESRFVFIGKNLDRRLILGGFEACLQHQALP